MIVKTRNMKWPVFGVLRFARSADNHRIGSAPIGNVLMRTCFILIACFWAFQASAQQTYNAASCSQAAVQTAINAELAHAVDGDIISIPPGTCTWTGGIAPSFAHSVTIQGAGAISATAGGASTTGTDQTVIINHNGSKEVMWLSVASGKTLRVTGIAVLEDSGSTVKGIGNMVLAGRGTIRVDHCHLFIAAGGSKGLAFYSGVTGVADHIYINTNQTVTNNLNFQNGSSWLSDNGGLGNGSWADSDHWGTNQFIFVEDSHLVGGYISDCIVGGRYVLRHSTILNSHGLVQHGTHDQYRSCRASESYLNTFSTPAGEPGGIMHNNGGASLAWGNTVTGFNNVIDLQYYRINGIPYGIPPAPPNGFGGCGAVTNGPSAWDQNSGSNGYPCLDLPGRGRGDLLTNFNTSFSDVLNSSTGTRTWPHQALSPIYAWANTLGGTGAGSIIGNHIGILTDNTDYFQQFGTFGESGSFDGTRGIGQGLLSARPSACTAGPGGNTPGVGYWATDTNTLYVCNPSNTWTAYYTPYTYPHPLVTGGTSTGGNSPNPPTALAATVQ